MRMLTRKRHLLALVLVTQLGCAPIVAVEPPLSPRIQIRADGALVQNGAVVDLLEATRDNPAAHAEALLAKRDGTRSTVLAIVGLGIALLTVLTGGALGAVKATRAAADPVLLGGALGGAGVTLGGSILGSNGQQHIYNAINLYNQGLPPPAPAPVPAQGVAR